LAAAAEPFSTLGGKIILSEQRQFVDGFILAFIAATDRINFFSQ
jgi:hypothetical protein